MQPSTIGAVTAMLTGLGTANNADPQVLLRAYLTAIEGIREDCVRETCMMFIRGQIKRDDYRSNWSPTCAVFAIVCREEQSAQEAREERSRRPRLPPPEQSRQFPKEHREKMIRNFATLKKALSGDKQAQDQLKSYGWRQS